MTDSTQYNEAQLLLRLASGDEKAFEEVYRTYFDPIYYYARRFMDNDEDAEDIASGVFNKLWIRRGEPFQSIAHLKSSLYTITRNDCLNHIKLLKRRSERELDVMRLQEGADMQEFASHEFVAEVMKRVDQVMESLPPQAARIFKLAYLEGRNNHEIADLLDINEHTVRNQKSRALGLLRSVLRILIVFMRF